MKLLKTLACALAAITWAAAAYSQQRNFIVFDRPTSSETPPAWTLPTKGFTNADPEWERESLPIGNGSFGGNVFGSVGRERVTLNEKSLWMGGPAADSLYWGMNKRVAPGTLDAVRHALLKGDRKLADSIVCENFNGLTPYNRECFGCFTTFGEATVETGIDERRITGYRRA